MNIEKLTDELKRDEGLRLEPYYDKSGNLTIGYGHLLSDTVRVLKAIDLETAEAYLKEDMRVAIAGTRFLCDEMGVDFDELSDDRQRVLCNMAFNLGRTKLSKFKRMWDRIGESDWDGAAWEMNNSRWAGQVGVRAERLAKMMREG